MEIRQHLALGKLIWIDLLEYVGRGKLDAGSFVAALFVKSFTYELILDSSLYNMKCSE